MIVFRSVSPSQPSSTLSSLLLLLCACTTVRNVESQVSASATMHERGCSTFSSHDGSDTKLCATAVESIIYEPMHEPMHVKEIDIELLNSTLTVSYVEDGECSIEFDEHECSACYLCADNEVAYDCANIPNGRCTVNKCERILQLAEPTAEHPNGRVQHFMLPVDLGLPLPPRECDDLHFSVLEDTWINPKLPNDSMEGKNRLRMSNANRFALIKFKVTNLMDGVSHGVHDAFLHVRTVDDIPSLSVSLPEGGYSSTGIARDDWDEELKTYHFLSDKSLVDQMVDFETMSAPIDEKEDLLARHWYSFDVSSVVTKNGMYTFLLKTDTPGIIVGVYGKGTKYEPELIVRPILPYTPLGGTTPPQTEPPGALTVLPTMMSSNVIQPSISTPSSD